MASDCDCFFDHVSPPDDADADGDPEQIVYAATSDEVNVHPENQRLYNLFLKVSELLLESSPTRLHPYLLVR